MNARIAAWHGGWLRRNGRLNEAKGVVFDSMWSDHQDPDLQAERVRVLHGLGETNRAEAAIQLLATWFPEHACIQELDALLLK
jgi:hypothetical protein